MPDVAVHASFGKEVLERLPAGIRETIHPVPFEFAQFGPDPWFMYKPWVSRREGRGRRMHTTKTGAFLMTLAKQAREGKVRDDMFSYLAGFLCHYALDTGTHPYIIRRTTTEFHYPRAHMSFEHSLDVKQMERDGHAGEKHPITDHYFHPRRLPKAMEEELNRVYETVYGWKDCHRALNEAYRLYRQCYRMMENPENMSARLARRSGESVLRSLVYSESFFREVDVENEAHAEWAHSHEEEDVSRESFPELREKAAARAVEMIEAAYGWIYRDEGTEEELSVLIGNRSYLSGLDLDDPRNMKVASLLPPEKEE